MSNFGRVTFGGYSGASAPVALSNLLSTSRYWDASASVFRDIIDSTPALTPYAVVLDAASNLAVTVLQPRPVIERTPPVVTNVAAALDATGYRVSGTATAKDELSSGDFRAYLLLSTGGFEAAAARALQTSCNLDGIIEASARYATTGYTANSKLTLSLGASNLWSGGAFQAVTDATPAALVPTLVCMDAASNTTACNMAAIVIPDRTPPVITGFAVAQSNYVYTCTAGAVTDGRPGVTAYLLMTLSNNALDASQALALAQAAYAAGNLTSAPKAVSASNYLTVAGLTSSSVWTGSAWSNIGPDTRTVYPNLVAADAVGNPAISSPPVALAASSRTYYFKKQATVAGMYYWDKMMGPQWSAALSDGSVAVVWAARSLTTGMYAVYVQICAGSTGTVPAARLLLADMELAGDSGEDMLPCVVALANRRFAVAWQTRPMSSTNYNAYVAFNTFTVTGAAAAPVVTADNATMRTYGTQVVGKKLLLSAHALPAASDAFVVTWSEYQTDVTYSQRNTGFYGGKGTPKTRTTNYNAVTTYHRDIEMIMAASTGAVASATNIATISSSSTNDEEVGAFQRGVALASGHHVVVWENSNTLYYRVFSSANAVVKDTTVFATVTGVATDANPFPNVSQGLSQTDSFLVTWAQNTFNDGVDAVVYGMELSVAGVVLKAQATLATVAGDTVVPATAFIRNGNHYIFVPSVGTSGATRLTRIRTAMATGVPASVARLELQDVAYDVGAPITVQPLPTGYGLPSAGALLTYIKTVAVSGADYEVQVMARLLDADTLL